MNTLAFGYVIPAIRAYSGLAPVRQCSCRAYNRKEQNFGSEVLLFSYSWGVDKQTWGRSNDKRGVRGYGRDAIPSYICWSIFMYSVYGMMRPPIDLRCGVSI